MMKEDGWVDGTDSVFVANEKVRALERLNGCDKDNG